MNMKVLVSDNISPKGVKILEKGGLDVDVNTGLSPAELKKIIGKYEIYNTDSFSNSIHLL